MYVLSGIACMYYLESLVKYTRTRVQYTYFMHTCILFCRWKYMPSRAALWVLLAI